MSGPPGEAWPNARSSPLDYAGSDHLGALLFEGVERASRGEFSVRGRWSIDAAEESKATLITAAHEYMHQVLNEFSVFGQLLSTLGLLAQLGDERAFELALKLLDQCRTTHEAYATFTSVVLSGTPPERALADYPGYDVYYASAAHLSGGLDPSTSLAGYHIVERALAECLSAPFVPGLFAEGLTAFRPRDIPPDCRPDKRFMILRGLLPSLAPQLLERVDRSLSSTHGASDLGPSSEWGLLHLDDHPGIEDAFADLLREELRRALRERNIPVLDTEDEMRAEIASLKDALLRDYPNNAEVLAITREVDRSEWETAAESVILGERLVFRRPPKRIRVTSDLDDWIGSAHAREIESLVALVATPARLREQYDIEPSDWLNDDHGRTVVWLVDPSPNQETLSSLWTRSYEDLDKGLRRLPGLMMAVVVMASTVPGEEWWESWGERLQERGDVVLYGDTNIVEILRLARIEGRDVTYSVIRIPELGYVNGVVLNADLGGFPLLWLGSGVARAILLKLLRSEQTGRVHSDDSLAHDKALQIALRYVVNHESMIGPFQGSSP